MNKLRLMRSWLVLASVAMALAWVPGARAQADPLGDLLGQTLPEVAALVDQTCGALVGGLQGPSCGNAVVEEGEDCESGDLAGATCADQGFQYGTLACGAECAFDVSGCTNERFVEGPTGETVIDRQTGLEWEKKVIGSSSSTDLQGVGDCLNCVSDTYNWTTAMSEWISALNGRSADGQTHINPFAGHTDWRLPQSEELIAIRDTSVVGCDGPSGSPPCIDPIFGPTSRLDHWSATTYAIDPSLAAVVGFTAPGNFGVFRGKSVSLNIFVRAVRGGSN